MKNKAVFLDRDGTINVDYGYVKSPDEVKIFDDVYEALKLLKSKGFLLIVVTNQSGVTRGLMTEEDVVATNEHINREIKQKIIEEQQKAEVNKLKYEARMISKSQYNTSLNRIILLKNDLKSAELQLNLKYAKLLAYSELNKVVKE